MSAHPFKGGLPLLSKDSLKGFQSAARGDLLFWGKKEGPMVVILESLSEQEKESCGASQKKGRRKSTRLSSAGKKSS